MSMKNVCMHTSHHSFLLGCCLLVCFCHLGHTVTRFLLSVLLVSGILLGFLSLPHYQLFLQNLSRAFPWVGDEGRALWASDAFPLPFFLSCLTGPVGHTLGPGFTDFTLEACSGEAPWHCKTHRMYILKTQYAPHLYSHRPYWLWVYGLERLPLKCSLPG